MPHNASLAWLKSLDWTIAHSPDIALGWLLPKLMSEELQVEVVEEFLENSLYL